jgi:hypothetical protein
MGNSGALYSPNTEGTTHMGTFWDFLIALSGIDDYVGQYNKDRELVLKPRSELTPKDIVIGK